MFINCKLFFTEPICNCNKKTLIFSLKLDKDKLPGLLIKCTTCETELHIPNKKFLISTVFEKPYPDEKEIDLGEINKFHRKIVVLDD